MRVRVILGILFVASISLTLTAHGQRGNGGDKTETKLFRRIQADKIEQVKTKGGLVIGDYYLSKPALESLRKCEILANAFRRIDSIAWSPFVT